MKYSLEKWIWTEDDFEQMGWHDSAVYGIRLSESLELDIDYIFKWNQPEIEGLPFTFYMAPCTLIFNKPQDLSFELTQSFDNKWIEIDDIEREKTEHSFRWTVITQQGDISFITDSFTQIVRQRPSLQFFQAIPYDERGGINFDRKPGIDKNNISKDQVLQRKQKELENYEMAKKRQSFKNQLSTLKKEKEAGSIDLKHYLLRKAELKNNIDSLTYYLRGSDFENW